MRPPLQTVEAGLGVRRQVPVVLKLFLGLEAGRAVWTGEQLEAPIALFWSPLLNAATVTQERKEMKDDSFCSKKVWMVNALVLV